jgi:nitric oxide reductase NorD protein
MHLQQLKKYFFKTIPSHPPNEWEIEEYLASLQNLDEEVQKAVLDQVSAIWPVSHSLCYSYLDQVANGLRCLDISQLAGWVAGMLDVYEAEGLRAAQSYMNDVEKNFLCEIRGETGLKLNQVRDRLQLYINGLSGEHFEIGVSGKPWTDTATIFLPEVINHFASEKDNYLYYKFLITCQYGHVALGTYCTEISREHPLIATLTGRYKTAWRSSCSWPVPFFNLYPDHVLVEDIFLVSQFCRILHWIEERYYGLYNDVKPLLRRLQPDSLSSLPRTKDQVLPFLIGKMVHAGDAAVPFGKNVLFADYAVDKSLQCLIHSENREQLLEAVDLLYRNVSAVAGTYHSRLPEFVGAIHPKEADEARKVRRQKHKQQFIQSLGVFLAARESNRKDESRKVAKEMSSSVQADEAASLLIDQAEEAGQNEDRSRDVLFVRIDDEDVSLPEDISRLATAIKNDLGGVPSQYISSAVGLSGDGNPGMVDMAQEERGGTLDNGLLYDEWDFRRNGFRKNWCRLLEKQSEAVSGTFVQSALQKHGGLLARLRRQFEMMRTQERFLKRRKDGDDIDFDALIDYCSDVKAGLAPDERVYVQLQRDERDIAAVFLVDMSASTEGWVSTAIKEALLLMGEALDILGDRFAIYGFSGMRRTRSEIFRIKDFTEPFNGSIRGRIAGIAPQDYTRMGPPIRHMTRLLSDIDARVRLMITLSDGKPEDYDDYKGRYAVEDTRHALIEAKAAGIHPFCITIDKKAQEYIGHMYGDINYIFINDINQLPTRMPAIYQGLTS